MENSVPETKRPGASASSRHRITRVTVHPLNLPVTLKSPGATVETSVGICVCQVETASGYVGTGITGITEEEVIASILAKIVAPAIIDEDAMCHEHIWEKMYWLLTPRGQAGYASHAISAIDVALWDIKGQIFGEPIWRLLGGARREVPIYTTFGIPFHDREQLAAAAGMWVARGHRRLKMIVGYNALKDRNARRTLDKVIREDIERIRVVREAVGDDVELFIDGNCSLDYLHALELGKRIVEYEISFFEEPITHNDALLLAELRRKLPLPIAAGQNEGLASRFRDFLINGSVDILQPNVVIGGGFTQCQRIAGMAAAFNLPIANGGGWTHHNMHLQAGVLNGSHVEYHWLAVEALRNLFDGFLEPHDDMLTLTDEPGLGFSLNQNALRELLKRPLSDGVRRL